MFFYWSGKTKKISQTLSGSWFTREDLYMLYKIKHEKALHLLATPVYSRVGANEETGQKPVFM